MTAFCTQCGAGIPEGVRFCTECGTAAGAAQPAQPVYAPPTRQTHIPPDPAAPVTSGDAPPPPGSAYAVMSTGAFFGHTILFAIPVIGWLVCLVVGLVLGGLFLLLFRSLLDGAAEYINSATDGMFGDLGGFGDLFGKMQNGLPGN